MHIFGQGPICTLLLTGGANKRRSGKKEWLKKIKGPQKLQTDDQHTNIHTLGSGSALWETLANNSNVCWTFVD